MQHPFDLNQSEPLEKGKLYHFNGKKLVEIEPVPGKKLTITNDAMEVVKQIRNDVGNLMGMRPELAVCASAMLLASMEISDIRQRVMTLGRAIYDQGNSKE